MEGAGIQLRKLQKCGRIGETQNNKGAVPTDKRGDVCIKSRQKLHLPEKVAKIICYRAEKKEIFPSFVDNF